MAKNKKNKKTALKHFILLALAVVFIAAIAFGILVLIKQIQLDNSPEQDNAHDINTASDIIKDEEDLKDENKVAESSNDAKDRFEADERTKKTVEKNESGLNIAEPVINFVAENNGKIEVGGAIPNINEMEGTCTYEFTKGSDAVTVNAEILPNPSYISCATATIDKSRFSNGVWKVKLIYKSDRSEGESEAQSYTIQ